MKDMKNTCCKNVSSENSHKSDLSRYYTYCGNNKKTPIGLFHLQSQVSSYLCGCLLSISKSNSWVYKLTLIIINYLID